MKEQETKGKIEGKNVSEHHYCNLSFDELQNLGLMEQQMSF